MAKNLHNEEHKELKKKTIWSYKFKRKNQKIRKIFNFN